MPTEQVGPAESGREPTPRRLVAGAGGRRLKPDPAFRPEHTSSQVGPTADRSSTGGAAIGDDYAARNRERLLAELSEKVAQLAARVRHIDRSLAHAESTLETELRTAADQRRRTSDEARRRTIESIQSATAQRRAALSAQLEDLLARSASGAFGTDFSSDWLGQTQPLSPPPLIRRGSRGGKPVLHPLFHDRGWYLQGPTDRTLAEIEFVVLRAVGGVPLKHLRIDVFDPRIEGRLGVFAPLRAVDQRVFPAASTTAASFVKVLEGATETAARNAEIISEEGCRNLGELWEVRGEPTGDYRLIVILNYPDGIDRATNSLLVRLARTGGPNGVVLLVQHDPTGQPSDSEVRPAELLPLLRASQIDAAGALILPDHPVEGAVQSDGEPRPDLIRSVIAAAAERNSNRTGPVVPLADLIAEDVVRPWQGDATASLDAAIARSGKTPITVSIRSENPPFPNILIGGGVGQGKSNLLLDLIYSLAARYSPEELALYLLDFKSGVEFRRFAADEDGRNWLPHAKVLGLESDREFGLAVLRYVSQEVMRRYNTVFPAVRVKGYDDYRRAGHSLPRILLIIDEFQVLFDGGDSLTDDAVMLLEEIARLGRNAGVHLVLASQTISGISGLRAKLDSILSLFPIRMSLKNTRSESEAMLSTGNTAAADLAYRGEVILNRNWGMEPEGHNERATSAFADGKFVADLQSKLWALRPGGDPPMVFVSTEFARWPDEDPGPGVDGEPVGLIGRRVATNPEPLEVTLVDDIDQATAVIGAKPELSLAVIAGLTRSIAISGGLRRVIVVDLGSPTGERAGESIGPTLALLEERGIEVLRVGRDRSIDVLTGEVRALLTRSGNRTLVVGLGWQRWGDLEQRFAEDPDDEYSDTYSLEDLLGQLASSGAASGVYLVGWWTTLGSLESQFSHRLRGFRNFVTVQLSEDDYRAITPSGSPAVSGYPRVGFYDRASDAAPVTVVPFDPVPVSP
jgi:S-DNA-T family DNA segregation ATPase FtsK/SpoIIIE